MIAFEVSLNGKRVCTAGADDLGVLSAIVTACGKLGKKTVPARSDEKTGQVHFSIGGLTSRSDPKKNIYMRWKSVAPLAIGDLVLVKIVETEKVDRAKSRIRAKSKRA